VRCCSGNLGVSHGLLTFLSPILPRSTQGLIAISPYDASAFRPALLHPPPPGGKLSAVKTNLLVFALLCFAAAAAPAVDLKRPPAPSDIDALASEGWPKAAQRLSRALTESHTPGKNGRPGASGDPAFAAWLDLWKGCELLSKSCDAETTALVQRHFFKERGTGKLFFLTPGQTPPDSLEKLPDAEALTMAAHPQIRDQLLQNALPRGSAIPSGTLADIAGPAFAKELLATPELLKPLVATLDPNDYAPLVLKNLRTLREADPKAFREYPALAIAIAVVNDSALPDTWPHSQVTARLVPKEVPPVDKQFERWVRAHEARQLAIDPRRLSPGQLKFVIDAFVAESELAWARKYARLARTNFDRAFFQVRYRPDRVKSQAFFWTDSPYTLEAIRDSGGICVDQAYYAMIAGKAHGIPTLFFTGQGRDGGHAWFGFLKRDDKWELDVGRYSNQNFAVGQALDPQTWQPISDHELKLLAARFRDKPEFAASQNDLALAALFEKANDPARAAAAYSSAIQTCPQNPDAWDLRAAFLTRSGAPLAERIRHHEDAVKRFAPIPDLKVRHQNALAELHRQGGNKSSAANLERSMLMQNRRNRPDLSVAVAAQKVNAAIKSGNLDAAAAEFHRQLHTLSKTGGGDFVRQVALPFIDALLAANQKNRARRAISTMRQHLSPERGSLLDLSLQDLEKATR
jgi:tetratricopeptide (TPR) repeat protein